MTDPWPNPDLSAHARTLRDAVKALRSDFREIADHLDPILEVADSLDALERPIVVTHPEPAPPVDVEQLRRLAHWEVADNLQALRTRLACIGAALVPLEPRS